MNSTGNMSASDVRGDNALHIALRKAHTKYTTMPVAPNPSIMQRKYADVQIQHFNDWEKSDKKTMQYRPSVGHGNLSANNMRFMSMR